MLETCEICGAPAEVDEDFSAMMNGVDDNGEFIVELLKVRCAAGHWYNKSGGEVHG